MKTNKIISIVVLTALFIGSCKQELIEVQPPAGPTTPPKPIAGSANFTKFVAVGNSFVAGMQAQALFNESQANSLPRIMAKQFETVGGPATFNQPDINSVNGFNPISSNLGIGLVLGRLILFDPDGSGPCVAQTSQMNLRINPLPLVSFTGFPTGLGIPPQIAENNSGTFCKNFKCSLE